MLAARKNRLLNALLYRALMLRGMQSAFHTVCLRQPAPAPPPDAPVILFANHPSWWDGHMAMALNEQVWRRDGYVMMDETQLTRYRFFRHMGAFSVDRDNPRAAALSLRYAAALLTAAPNRLLLIFPQGEIVANDARPLRFYTGVGHIARRTAPCLAYPLALRYEFVAEQKPEAFISVGAPVVIEDLREDARAITRRMERALTDELDRLRDDVIAHHFAAYTPIIHGARSINRLWDAARGKPPIKPLGPA